MSDVPSADVPPPSSAHAADRLFAGGGEMGERMRALDWSRTPLGPVEGWAHSLRTTIRILLTSRHAMWLGWGRDLLFFYNDAYVPTLGVKHATALGQPFREVWAEVWDDVRDRVDAVMQTGVATWDEGLRLFLERSGYPEETYHTFSYSPIPDDDGGIGGLLCVVTEDTERRLGERRLALLRDLASDLASTHTEDDVCRATIARVADRADDLPFLLLYRIDDGGRVAHLACAGGAAPGSAVAPATIDLETGDAVWPVRTLLARGEPIVVDDLVTRVATLPTGAWDRPPRQAMLLPIASQARELPAGFMVAGVNPYRPVDPVYAGFLQLLSVHVGSGLANARAHAEERHRAQALAELDRAKTDFFSNVSHEFRTPLALLLGPLDELLARADLAAPVREGVEMATRNGRRLLRLVNTLLDFSRIEAGRIQASYEPTDVARLTADLASVFASAMERAGLRFAIDCAPIAAPVYLDREMWEKIVLNLLSNALKFTTRGTVAVRLRDEGERIALSVQDTGAGIPAGELPRVFDRFHRVRGAAGRTHEGTGIGLALVAELARLHGGTVGVESAPQVGSTFTVRIPTGAAHLPPERIATPRLLASTATAATAYLDEASRWFGDGVVADAAPPAVAPAATAGARILLADDNRDMREYVGRLLGAHWRVEAVADGEAALAAIARERPDLVLADVMMPRLDGFGLLAAIRADPRTQVLPVVLLSARAGEEATVEGLEAGADEYLVKPFSARELVAKVAAQLELTRLRSDAAAREARLNADLSDALAAAEQARDDAEQASRAKDTFLAVLSHELRSPLNAMVGWIRVLQLAGSADPTVTRAVETLDRNVWVQAQIIDDLLDVSRIVSGKLHLDLRPVRLGALVAGCLESLRPAVEARGLQVRLQMEGDDPVVLGDAARLQQVVGNLLGNAVKFTGAGGRIDVVVAGDAARARVTIRDTGQGIDTELLPQMFELFRQGDGKTSRRHGGLGLGLAIVKLLAERHGGTVSAASEGEGRGATFVLTLPVAAPGATAVGDEPAPARAESSIGPVDVLLVEDEADTRAALAIMLERSGAHVRVAASVREALESYDVRRPDVLLSDVGMPVEDGYALIRAIRQREDGRPARTLAIALTGFASREDHETALRAGFDDHLCKPVDPDALVERVRVLAAARDAVARRHA